MRWNTGRGQVERAQLLPAPVDRVAEDNEGEVVGVARSRLKKTIGPNRRRGGGTARTCIKNSSRQLLRLSKVLSTFTSNTSTQQSAPARARVRTNGERARGRVKGFTSVEGDTEGLKAFLARGIPYLHCDQSLVHRHLRGSITGLRF